MAAGPARQVATVITAKPVAPALGPSRNVATVITAKPVAPGWSMLAQAAASVAQTPT